MNITTTMPTIVRRSPMVLIIPVRNQLLHGVHVTLQTRDDSAGLSLVKETHAQALDAPEHMHSQVVENGEPDVGHQIGLAVLS